MPFLNDLAYDSGLSWVSTNGTQVDVCSSEPANQGAISGVSLGTVSSGVTFTGPADGDTSGRKITLDAVSGTASATGTATHWAISNGSSILVATGTITSQPVTSGNSFSLAAIKVVELADAT